MRKPAAIPRKTRTPSECLPRTPAMFRRNATSSSHAFSRSLIRHLPNSPPNLEGVAKPKAHIGPESTVRCEEWGYVLRDRGELQREMAVSADAGGFVARGTSGPVGARVCGRDGPEG